MLEEVLKVVTEEVVEEGHRSSGSRSNKIGSSGSRSSESGSSERWILEEVVEEI